MARVAEFLLQGLHLSKEEARQLAMVARALTREEPPQQGSASTPSTGQLLPLCSQQLKELLQLQHMISLLANLVSDCGCVIEDS